MGDFDSKVYDFLIECINSSDAAAWNDFRTKNPDTPILLEGANLAKMDLKGYNLSRAVLRKANMRNTKLQNADLSDSDLSYANLTNSNIKAAILTGSLRNETNFQMAKLDILTKF